MIDITKLIQARAFARQDGAILGLVWIASFICTMEATVSNSSLLGLASNLLILSTPFVVARRLKSFRDYACEGEISFRRALFYCVQSFFNATLLLTIVQYLWFRFMDMGPFMAQLQLSYKLVMDAYQLTAEQSKAMLDAVMMMKPLAWAALFMITDLVVGCVLSPIIALTMTRKKNKL